MPEHLQLPLNRKGVISAEIFKVEGQLRVGFFIVNERPCKLHHKCRIVDCGVFLISGSYGWRKTKDAMPKLVERGGICEVDEAEARRLVALGVAAIVREADEAPVASGSTVESGDTPCADMPSEENGAESNAEAHLDAEQLQKMTVAQLKELAAELGIETAKLRKKDDLIAAIAAVPVEPGEEISEDDLPELSADAPVV